MYFHVIVQVNYFKYTTSYYTLAINIRKFSSEGEIEHRDNIDKFILKHVR